MKKRILLFILAFTLSVTTVLCLCSCDKSPEENIPAPHEENKETEPVIYTVTYDTEDGTDAEFAAQWLAKAYSMRGIDLSVSENPTDGAYIKLDINGELPTDWSVVFDGDNITVSGKNKNALDWGLANFTGSRFGTDGNGNLLISDKSDMSGDMSACAREGWSLPIPAYEGGTLSQKMYNCGSGIEKDSKEQVFTQSYMIPVSETTREEYEAYIRKLIANGYKEDSASTNMSPEDGENLYGQYVNGVSVVYAYFTAAMSEVRIIDDRASIPESLFETDYAPTDGDTTDIILYGLQMHPLGINAGEEGGDDNINNCGEFMVIRTPDNGLILIDGGSKNQATDTAVENAWKYLHEITGTREDQQLRISCWFISHPHGDHCNIVCKMLEKYGDMIKIERLMFNFFNKEETGQSPTETARTSILKYCPEAMVMKCHTGQSINLGGAVLDIMLTHEDLTYAVSGGNQVGEVNSGTTVLRVTAQDEQRAMILGDATSVSERLMRITVNKEEFKSRIVQVAHHAWNRLPTMYKNIAAEYALWPQYEYTDFVNVNEHRSLAYAVAESLTASGVKYNYFAGLNTARLICKNGEIEVVLTDTVY